MSNFIKTCLLQLKRTLSRMSRTMGDSHKRFLQTIMSSGVLFELCIYIAFLAHYTDRLDDFINVINTQLQPFFMHIRKGMSEEDGLEYYSLVNVTETDITRMASDYAENEKIIQKNAFCLCVQMDLIVDSESGTASSTDVLNCADSLRTKKLKKKEGQVVKRDTFICSFVLLVRCIVEMEQYMRRIYQDLIKVCHVYHNIALQCQMCETPACGIKMHLLCVARYFRARSDPRCPACNDFWPHEIPGELENTALTPSRRSRRS
uniref:Non-structural maintenance of chromosomes element 1 homolog n=1 Tax=Cyprinus carpio TaxID=7962 RepID=A0A8C2KDD8_CYPCA